MKIGLTDVKQWSLKCSAKACGSGLRLCRVPELTITNSKLFSFMFLAFTGGHSK